MDLDLNVLAERINRRFPEQSACFHEDRGFMSFKGQDEPVFFYPNPKRIYQNGLFVEWGLDRLSELGFVGTNELLLSNDPPALVDIWNRSYAKGQTRAHAVARALYKALEE